MKALLVIAALAVTATFAFGTTKNGTESVSAHHAKIEEILDEAK